MNHHAYILESARSSDFLSVIAQHSGSVIAGNSDVTIFNVESLSIDEARQVIERAQFKPHGDKNIIIIATDFVSPVTQNALLKVMEEPPEKTVIYLVIPYVSMLLPTLRSRVQMLSGNVSESSLAALAQKIIAAPHAERLELIAYLHDTDAEESDGEKKRGEALHVLLELQKLCAASPDRLKDPKAYACRMRVLEDARVDLLQTGSMMKMILEAAVLLV